MNELAGDTLYPIASSDTQRVVYNSQTKQLSVITFQQAPDQLYRQYQERIAQCERLEAIKDYENRR